MAERAGFEPAGRWRDHGLASRYLGPLGQRSKKNTGTPGGIRTLKTLCLRQGRMPVPSPGPIQNLLSTSAVPLRDHPVGCGVSLHVAPAGLPRTSPPPRPPALAATACTGTAEVGRKRCSASGCWPCTCFHLDRCKARTASTGEALRSVVKGRSPGAKAHAACAARSPHTRKRVDEKQNGPETLAGVRAVAQHPCQVRGMKGVRLGTTLPRKAIALSRIKLGLQLTHVTAAQLGPVFGQTPNLDAKPARISRVHQRATAEAADCRNGGGGKHGETLLKKR